MPNNYQIKDSLNDDLLCLIMCCQTNPSEEEKAFIHSYLSRMTNTRLLITVALKHGIVPLIYKTLKNLFPTDNPNHTTLKPLLTQLKIHYQSIVQRNMLMSAELIKLDQLTKELGITLLPFKGPALAQIAYKDISLRQFSDLDILVHRKDFRVLAEKMLERGYEPLYPIETFSGDKVMFEMNNDCPFYDTRRSLAVELHWDFFRKLALPTKKFYPWDNRQNVTINRYVFQTLSNETHLLYHSLHGSKHVWERFGWVVDIDRYIRTVPDLDWDQIITMAKDMGALKMFLLGPALAQHYLQTPLPEKIKDLCEPSNLTPFLEYVESEFNSDDPSAEESLVKLGKVIGLRDTLYYKAITLLEFLFRPGINERRSVIFSDKFFWLYWLLRPIGMGWRFIFCRLLKLCTGRTK